MGCNSSVGYFCKKMRTPNTQCRVCKKDIYQRPKLLANHQNSYCSRDCYLSARGPKTVEVTCKHCGKPFKVPQWKQNTQPRKYCSKGCGNTGRRGSNYSRTKFRNPTIARLELLKNTFSFDSCMVDGCHYNTTYDIHRHVPGRDGGKYEIGNMFAICPNHHAEITRKIIVVDKMTDCRLVIRKDNPIGDGSTLERCRAMSLGSSTLPPSAVYETDSG